MKTLFLTWQDEKTTRRWFVVGRLDRSDGTYYFQYVNQVKKAVEYGFTPLTEFPDLRKVYESRELFPLFANRLLPKSRNGYQAYLDRLAIHGKEPDPFEILARSEGLRTTDNFEVFLKPEPNSINRYQTYFFVRGIRHIEKDLINPDVENIIRQLETDDELSLIRDEGNQADSDALFVIKENEKLGWVPRYLCLDIELCLNECSEAGFVRVEKVNLPPAPVQQRLLCFFDAPWPNNSRVTFSDNEYQGMVKVMV